MKKKLTKMLMFFVVATFVSTSVFAVTSTEMLNKVESVSQQVSDIKQEYETVLATYSELVDTLSTESQNVLKTLTDKLLAEGIKTKLDTAKVELESSSNPDADKVLAAVEKIKENADKLIAENKEILSEVQANYTNLSIDEAKQLINKVTENSKALGVEKDTTETYSLIMSILKEAHSQSLEINTQIEKALTNDEEAIKNTLTIINVEKVFEAIKTKSQKNVIEVLIEIIDDTDGTSELKQDLTAVKEQVKKLNKKLLEIDALDEEAIMLFSNDERQNIVKEVEKIEQEYVNFAKKVINNYTTKYVDTLVENMKELTLDELLDKANEVLDYYDECSSVMNELKSGSFLVSNLSSEQKKLAKKVVVMEFVDTEKYNKNYLNDNFSKEIGMLKDYVLDTVVDYMDYIDTFMKNEVSKEIGLNSVPVAQLNIKNINLTRFNTIQKIKTLKLRIEGYLSEKLDANEALNQGIEVIYSIYYNNILETIEKIMLLENQKQDKTFEFDSLYYRVVMSEFTKLEDIGTIIGIPEKSTILTSENLVSGKVKTGSTFTIKLSDSVYQMYTNIVLGDVYADGVVDARDYMAIKNYIMGKDSLSDITLTAADTYRDNQVNAQDYMKIKNQIMEKDTISL